MQVYRITTAPFAADAFTGDGARLHGGRWNPKGSRMVYAAATRSLALMEMLVQDQPLRARYVFIPAEWQSRLRIRRLSSAELPPDWRKPTASERLRRIGQDWLERGESAVLAVPSAVLPREENFLLNPDHADFRKLRIGKAEPLDLDSRLLRVRF